MSGRDCTNPVVATRTIPREEQGPEDDERLLHRFILGCDAHARWIPHLGRGLRNLREQRQEGSRMVTSHAGFARGRVP